MTTRDAAPTGAPCWIDLMTSDVERSRDFYGQLFGWTAGDAAADFGGYFMFTKDGIPVSGAMPAPPGFPTPNQWGIYLAVRDARKTVETALASGGQVRFEAMDVADLGTSAVIADPGGAQIGMWQPRAFDGFGVRSAAGAPIWFELHTRDYEAAVTFYRDVFAWDPQVVSDTPEYRLTTLGSGEAAQAGIMDASGWLAERAAAYWMVYFGVDDADAALATISRLGGSVVTPAKDTPHGRLATAADPVGAEFKLVAPNEATPTRTEGH